MSRGNAGENPGRARTALVRMGLRIAGVKWEDGDEEDGGRFGMRAIPWRHREAYLVAVLVGLFVACGSIWVLGALATPGGILFWVLLPVALLAGFAGLQVIMLGGAVLAPAARRILPGWRAADSKWVAGVVLLGLTAAAAGMCRAGGAAGWAIGLLWLVPAGLNVLAWLAEKVSSGEE